MKYIYLRYADGEVVLILPRRVIGPVAIHRAPLSRYEHPDLPWTISHLATGMQIAGARSLGRATKLVSEMFRIPGVAAWLSSIRLEDLPEGGLIGHLNKSDRSEMIEKIWTAVMRHSTMGPILRDELEENPRPEGKIISPPVVVDGSSCPGVCK